MADESKFMVYRRVLVGENTMETIQKCLVTWGDKLQADLISRDESTINFAKKALEIEEMMVKFSEIFLPNRFKGKNYSRLNAVYAFPFEFPENWCYPNFIPPNRNFVNGESIIRMLVDGSSALVLPMYELNGVYNNLITHKEKQEKIKIYWESAVSLKEFARNPASLNNLRKKELDWYFRYNIGTPELIEVLIPESKLETISFIVN